MVETAKKQVHRPGQRQLFFFRWWPNFYICQISARFEINACPAYSYDSITPPE